MSKFIVLEGIDRSGKTTQINRLYDHYQATDLQVFKTREPWSEEVRKKLKEKVLTPEQQLDLILKDRANHCALIKAMLSKVDLVLCDRFTLSTLAYQGYGQGLGVYELNKKNEIVTQGLFPDVTILLDCPIAVGLKRGFDKPLDMIERDVPFLDRVRLAYVDLAKKNGYPIVDSSQTEDVVFNKLLEIIDSIGNKK